VASAAAREAHNPSRHADLYSTFKRVNVALGYHDITIDHARRFKDDLIHDSKIRGATKERLWGLLRALLAVAVAGRLSSMPGVTVG
jgi:hypothetical protein